MSDIRGTISRSKGTKVVVEIQFQGKLKDPAIWPECYEKLKELFKQYGSIRIKEVKKR